MITLFNNLKKHKAGSEFMTIQSSKETSIMFDGYIDELELVYRNGEIFRNQSFQNIRKIANSYL